MSKGKVAHVAFIDKQDRTRQCVDNEEDGQKVRQHFETRHNQVGASPPAGVLARKKCAGNLLRDRILHGLLAGRALRLHIRSAKPSQPGINKSLRKNQGIIKPGPACGAEGWARLDDVPWLADGGLHDCFGRDAGFDSLLRTD
ncbi:hypothetical protein [Allopusillimonas soli]|uniref:Uncharacterized protein n=1 Tax=Allopusillimonas soli TaxID=659016 RepID=A0A853FBA5_9BURK|nr:hypothetical protein [Allopusillimonas soli]NYT35346.1 hypothetical protein [Allopusillimonas soli]